MTMRMVSAVTPSDVAPPFTTPLGHGTTHCGANKYGTLTLPVAGSQSGAASAVADPTPGAAMLACAAAAEFPAGAVGAADFAVDWRPLPDDPAARDAPAGAPNVGAGLMPSEAGGTVVLLLSSTDCVPLALTVAGAAV